MPTKKATSTRPAAKKTVAKNAVVRRSPAKKAPAKKVAARKAPVKKVPARKAPVKAVAVKKVPARKAPAKKATPPRRLKSPYDKKFFDAQRELLLIERARRVHDAEALTAEANELAMLREPGDVQFDEESGEGDTLAVERERDLALSAQFRSEVEEIDRAMAKIGHGIYGLCEVSGQAIPKERLRAIPWARELVEFKAGGFGRR